MDYAPFWEKMQQLLKFQKILRIDYIGFENTEVFEPTAVFLCNSV